MAGVSGVNSIYVVVDDGGTFSMLMARKVVKSLRELFKVAAHSP